jgi:hypothetical protein
MDPRQMRRQRSAIGSPLLLGLGRRLGRRFRGLLLLLLGVLLGSGGLEILHRQLQLVMIQSFGLLAELGILQLLQQMAEFVILLDQPPIFRNRGIALARQLAHQCP